MPSTLPALTLTATEAVGAQFGPTSPWSPVGGRTGLRAALAAALERAARALAPRHPRSA